MEKLIFVSTIIFLLAVLMTMAGRGGGNFYVLLLVLAGLPMHQAATTGQFILFTTALSALVVFQKNKVVVWPLAVFIGILTASAAFAGGYFSHWISEFILKIIFSILLAVAGAIMLFPVSERTKPDIQKFGYWRFQSGGKQYTVNLWLASSVTLATGFGAGMVGVSGGSFLVPLMVLACGVPMRIAVGTASTLIAATALAGFAGHAIQGDFNPLWAVPLAAVTVAGGFIGGKFAIQTKPKHLKQLFAYTTLAASIFMAAHAFYVRF